MKFTKKHWIIAAITCLTLAGGSAVLVANHQAQVQADKIAQEEKAAYDKLIKAAQEATEKAETFKAEADVKTAQDAIKKLKEKNQKDLNSRIEKVRKNWDLYHQADKSVSAAEKSKTDATVKTAQNSVNKLKDAMTKSKKADLQKRLDKIKAEIKSKKDKEQARAKAQTEQAQSEAAVQTSDNTQVPASQAGVPTTGTTPDYGSYSQAAATPSYTAPASGGGAVVPAQPSPSTGNPAYNSGAGLNANSNMSIAEGDKLIEEANANPGGAPSANGGR
ncbi:serine protease [Lactococcus ileimucosae]|uniref:serine protease n=1 Tax=Lactococcus ileimucosae TaxID=2941329 RepID=UPI002043ED03|nr:serine protease [Lactococcus ileimucosae]